MTLDEIIAKRRSIRKYDPSKPVMRETLELMVKAAIEAPSWKNTQTSRYHIVTSADMMSKLRDCMPERNSSKVKDAGALVITTFRKDIAGFELNGEPTNELGNGWGIYDLGLSDSILLLKAAELGLDSLVLGIRNAEEIRKVFSIPDNETVVSVIAFGHRVEDAQRPKRKDVTDIATFY